MLLVRLLGQRALARMSSTDLAVIIVVGAVIGRGPRLHPALTAGIPTMLTLFAMQALAGNIRRSLKTAWRTGLSVRIVTVLSHVHHAGDSRVPITA